MTLELAALASTFVLGLFSGAGLMVARRRRALRRLQVGEKRITVTPMPERLEQAFDAETFTAAIVEQLRREAAHPGPRYRHDQRVRAVQQRLSRRWGPAAFTPELRRRIEEALSA